VVTGFVFGYNATGDLCKGVCEKRNSAGGPCKADPELRFESRILLRLGEIFGDCPLRGLQNVDGETTLGFEIGKQARVVIDADEHEQGIERDGSEGIGGHAVNLAGFAFDGDDGYTGSKAAHDSTEMLRRQRRSGHRELSKIAQGQVRSESGKRKGANRVAGA